MLRSTCTPLLHDFFSVQRRDGLFWAVEGGSDASDTLCFNTFVYQLQLQYKYQEHDKFNNFCLSVSEPWK